jgi:hypothetical protein
VAAPFPYGATIFSGLPRYAHPYLMALYKDGLFITFRLHASFYLSNFGPSLLLIADFVGSSLFCRSENGSSISRLQVLDSQKLSQACILCLVQNPCSLFVATRPTPTLLQISLTAWSSGLLAYCWYRRQKLNVSKLVCWTLFPSLDSPTTHVYSVPWYIRTQMSWVYTWGAWNIILVSI